MIRGWATPEGTKALREKSLSRGVRSDFFKLSVDKLTLSSVGMGTYLGTHDEDGDHRYEESLRYGLEHGVNVIDTAIKYRGMRSEKTIAQVLQRAMTDGVAKREEIFISSKGGLIGIPSGRDEKTYIKEELVGRLGTSPESIFDGESCLDPRFIDYEFELSLQNLQLETLDCYFLHNPEVVLKYTGEDFYDTLIQLFELLEQKVSEGKLRNYGLASWKGLRVSAESEFAIDLKRVLKVANTVGGNSHHCKYLQIPLSIGMPQTLQAHASGSIFQQAKDYGLTVFTSSTLYGGKLEELQNLNSVFLAAGEPKIPDTTEHFRVSLPQSFTSLVQFVEYLLLLRERKINLREQLSTISQVQARTTYPGALDVVRSVPEVTTALISCNQKEQLEENLRVSHQPVCEAKALEAFWRSLLH